MYETIKNAIENAFSARAFADALANLAGDFIDYDEIAAEVLCNKNAQAMINEIATDYVLDNL